MNDFALRPSARSSLSYRKEAILDLETCLNEKNRGNTNIAGTSQQTLQSQSPGSRHAAGGTPGRPAHAGQASQRRRAQRWSRRFGGLPVRGTAPHCATTIRGTTLGIADQTRTPPAAGSDHPDTMGGSCLVPVMHWTSARRACGGVCAPLRHSRSDTGFALAASKVERSMRRCAVKLLFWHSPRYACTHPGRTILPCVLDG